MPPTRFALTAIERRFWWLHHLHPLAPVANIGRVVDLRGPLDAAALARAYDAVAAHPMLRVRVLEDDGAPIGILGSPGALVVDVADVGSGDIAGAIDAVVKAPFSLEAGPLLRARLLRHGKDHHTLVLGAHHLILDGWALSRSVPRALCAALRGEDLHHPTDDTWLAQRAARDAELDPIQVEADLGWWRKRLSETAVTSLPTLRPAPPRPSGWAHDVEVPLDGDFMSRVGAFAATHKTRISNVFLAAVAIEIGRAAGTSDFLLGTTRASRADDDDGSFSCEVRSKALHLHFPAEASFLDVMASARVATKESLSHGSVDAEDLMIDGAPPLTGIFNFISFDDFDGTIDGVDIKAGRIIAGGTAFPVAITVEDRCTPPRLVVEVAADLFDAASAVGIANRIKILVDEGMTSPTTSWRHLPRLGKADHKAIATCQATDAERAPVVGGHLGRAVDDDLDDDLAADLAAAEGQNPIAMVFIADPLAAADDDRGESVTRRQVRRRAHRLAAHLRADGFGPGDFVGVCCRDPLRTVEAIFGVLFAGAAYVPLDPSAPRQRQEAIATQASLRRILDDDDVTRHAFGPDVDDLNGDDWPAIPGSGADPAYAIFTSGSTGTPKGVVISHDAVMSQLQARTGCGFPKVDRSLLLAPFFFDGSIETLFWSFTTGGTLHLLSDEARRDPLSIRQALSRRAITYTSAVPALWGAMLESVDVGEEPLTALAFVIVGGEKLTPQLIEKHNSHTTARLVNEYGPTESTVFSSWWPAPAAGIAAPTRVPIGRAAPHVRCYVVDDALEPVPLLEPGELIVAGPGLADGYLAAPEQTNAAFVTCQTPAGLERVYRTGDLVRLWPDGNLEWLSRKDDQVKLRGVRVEPGEVEAAILTEGVAECVVVVEDENLLAYVVPVGVETSADEKHDGAAPTFDEAALVERLRSRLPDAMVPARIIALWALPKTANDKVDRKRLPRVAVDDQYVAPTTPTESAIAEVWRDVLAVERVSVTQSFFAYGGHSLKAAVVVRRVKEVCDVDVPLSALMVARTVRELARAIDEKKALQARQAFIKAHPHQRPSEHLGATTDLAPLMLPLSSRSAQGNPEIVFLPGVGGHVFTFTPLADRMTSRAAGLRTWGSEPGEEPFGSIEALATHNNTHLDQLGVGDDVILAGYSFGGLVAFEMALQRLAAGRCPSRLVIFDTMAPGYPKKLPAMTRARLHLEGLLGRDWAGRAAYVRDRVESIKEKWAFKMQKADAFNDAFALNADQLEALPQAKREQLERLAGVSTLAYNAYWPRTSTSIPTTLFAAEHPFDWAATKMDDPLLGWRSWLNLEVDRVELRGAHLELFQEDNLSVAARVLDSLVQGRRRR